MVTCSSMKKLPYAEKFPLKLALAISARGSSQEKVAKHLGIVQSGVSKMQDGKRRPFMDQVVAIARFLNVSLDYLCDDRIDGLPDDAPSDKERSVRAIIDRYGWDWVYWRLIDMGRDDDRLRPISPTHPEAKGEEEKMAEKIKRKPS